MWAKIYVYSSAQGQKTVKIQTQIISILKPAIIFKVIQSNYLKQILTSSSAIMI